MVSELAAEGAPLEGTAAAGCPVSKAQGLCSSPSTTGGKGT